MLINWLSKLKKMNNWGGYPPLNSWILNVYKNIIIIDINNVQILKR